MGVADESGRGRTNFRAHTLCPGLLVTKLGNYEIIVPLWPLHYNPRTHFHTLDKAGKRTPSSDRWCCCTALVGVGGARPPSICNPGDDEQIGSYVMVSWLQELG